MIKLSEHIELQIFEVVSMRHYQVSISKVIGYWIRSCAFFILSGDNRYNLGLSDSSFRFGMYYKFKGFV